MARIQERIAPHSEEEGDTPDEATPEYESKVWLKRKKSLK
jgi:hypothetical protein